MGAKYLITVQDTNVHHNSGHPEWPRNSQTRPNYDKNVQILKICNHTNQLGASVLGDRCVENKLEKGLSGLSGHTFRQYFRMPTITEASQTI